MTNEKKQKYEDNRKQYAKKMTDEKKTKTKRLSKTI